MARTVSKTIRTSLSFAASAVAIAACAHQIETVSPEPVDAASTVSEPAAVASYDSTFPVLTETNDDAFTEDGLAALEAKMRAFVADGDAAGVTGMLVKDGKVVQYVEEGIMQAETGEPIKSDTIHRIYSMTKPITGVAMMMLYEEGAFELDDPITKFVPEFEGLKILGQPDEDENPTYIDANRVATMRDLMAHRAGFGYGFDPTESIAPLYGEAKVLLSPDLPAFIDRLADQPLMLQPGEKWVYSVGVDVQGAIIERITGKTFGEFLSERMFEPLGMVDTGFVAPNEKLDRLSDPFFKNPETGELLVYTDDTLGPIHVNFTEDFEIFESGGLGLVSTLPDYARFLQMLANDGVFDGNRYLKTETIELMRTNTMPEGETLVTPGIGEDDGGVGLGFGLNFGVVHDAELSPTPYGEDTYFWGGALATWFWIDPEHDLYYVGMVQVMPIGEVRDFRAETADAIYSALKR
ncbi:MAG: serine hydrolase domain-containing protein [Pseudomonadota bacterium]